jgi:hypothetical protein
MSVPPHPAGFSPEVIDVLAELIGPRRARARPYGGHGLCLGALYDLLGATFTATDIEDWPGADRRVGLGNSELDSTDPPPPFTVADLRQHAALRLRQGWPASHDPAARPARLRHLAPAPDARRQHRAAHRPPRQTRRRRRPLHRPRARHRPLGPPSARQRRPADRGALAPAARAPRLPHRRCHPGIHPSLRRTLDCRQARRARGRDRGDEVALMVAMQRLHRGPMAFTPADQARPGAGHKGHDRSGKVMAHTPQWADIAWYATPARAIRNGAPDDRRLR